MAEQRCKNSTNIYYMLKKSKSLFTKKMYLRGR